MTIERPAEPVALVDMDGTLCDFDGAMQAALESLRGPSEDPTLHQCEHEDLPYMKARRRMIKKQPGFWSGLAPLKLGFDVLEELHGLRFSCYILTKGPRNPPDAWAEKFEWCQKAICATAGD
jgi:FMN phosphatase YigB (HAD superfamily)